MCNDILVIGPSDGVVCENKDFLNWLEQAQKRSLVKFQMSSKQPSFARMPRNRGHLAKSWFFLWYLVWFGKMPIAEFYAEYKIRDRNRPYKLIVRY